MNNEFKTITIIALSQVDVSKKYKMKTGACVFIQVHLYSKVHQCIFMTYGHRTNTKTG